jgi:uncharacterized coiled-coil protein SlyX
MAECIEIRNDGSVLCRELQIGTVQITTPFPSEFSGYWFTDDPVEDADLRIESLEAQVNSLEEDLEDCKEGLSEAEKRADEAEKSLDALRDEVRAVLAGGEYCEVSQKRLRDALEEAGG